MGHNNICPGIERRGHRSRSDFKSQGQMSNAVGLRSMLRRTQVSRCLWWWASDCTRSRRSSADDVDLVDLMRRTRHVYIQCSNTASDHASRPAFSCTARPTTVRSGNAPSVQSIYPTNNFLRQLQGLFITEKCNAESFS